MADVVAELVNAPEGQFLEKKSARIKPKDIIKHLIAFANASGGKLVIGIEDDGQLTGFEDVKAHRLEAFTHVVLTQQKSPLPLIWSTLPMTNHLGEADCLLIFEVLPAKDKVMVADDGQSYLRSKDCSVLLKYEQRQQLEYDKGQRSFEDEVVQGASFSELNLPLLEQYRYHLNATHSSIEDILIARNFLTQDHQLTNACVLLFGDNPCKYFPNARIKIIRYEGRSQKTGMQLNIVKEFAVEGAIPQMIIKTRELINSQLREFQTLDATGKFIQLTEYPEFAWFEGVVNALTHRNYAMMGDYVRISIYDDRLEVFSPGALPNIVTLENMLTTRYSRNPRIARVLSEFGWVKELNEGVKRIFNEMEAHLLNEPIYTEPNQNSVQLTLENNIVQRQLRDEEQISKLLTERVINQLNQYELQILHHVYANEQITTKVASEILGKSDKFVRRQLKSLHQQGILAWVGSSLRDPTQYFILNLDKHADDGSE